MQTALTNKYNVPGPRYTSYPTLPYWNTTEFSLKAYKESFQKSFKESNTSEGISLYVHLPFCESLCTFCGCNKRITKNHSVEKPYLKTIIKEWNLYIALMDEKPRIKEIHLGGGTPTFFSAENLQYLLEGLFLHARRTEDIELSFEGHPNNTTAAHLSAFAAMGFTRVSYGVQDYNNEVQRAIHRVQPFENVKKVTDEARALGFTSVGHDLIFGLPFQTVEHVIDTVEKTKLLMPDRIAFYSYAHVPWVKGSGQRGFRNEDLPSGEQKREQYETGKRLLLEAGYVEIGMDHFALPSDGLNTALENRELHRNFMGYSSSKTQLMIGLGASAISDSWYGFAQNVKGVEAYEGLVENDLLPISRGHILTEEDLCIRQHILNLMCTMQTSWNLKKECFNGIGETLGRLAEMQEDDLITIGKNQLTVLEKGRPFVRNVCMAFDLHLQRSKPESQLFSMTV